MLKQVNSTDDQQKRRLQLALDLPADVEARLRKEASCGFRSLSKEVTMRLVQSFKQEPAQPA